MRAVFGLINLDAGAVRWDGVPVGQSERRRFGYMPEERGLDPAMLVGDQLDTLAPARHERDPRRGPLTTKWPDRLGIADRLESKVDALSHGNQQRVQLAAALLHNPDVLILDEPLAGLDPSGIDAIGEVLVEQARLRMLRCLFQSRTRPGRGSVRVGHDNRPRSPGCEREGRRSGHERGTSTRGSGRWRPRGAWARSVAGVTISEVDAGGARG